MEILLALSTALVLGTVHALEPDHMAAVSAFVVRRPGRRAAMGFGLRWAAGHGAAVLVVGLGLVLLSTQLPESVSAGFEKLAGAVLVALGVWTVATARRVHAHTHTHADGTAHAHLHVHGHEVPAVGHDARSAADTDPAAGGGSPAARHAHGHAAHEHGHAVTMVGALHGLAGTAPVVALLPLASFESPALASGYLLMFGVGTAAGMVVYAMFAGWLAGRAAHRSEALARGIMRGTGVLTAIVGFVWLLR